MVCTLAIKFFDHVVREIGGQMAFEEGKLVNIRSGGGAAGNGNGNGHGIGVKLGELTMPGGGFTLPIPPNLQEVMRKSLNRHIVLGIRPEHFHLRPIEGSEMSAAVKMVLNVIEPLGNDMDVYMHTRLHDHVVGRVEAQAGLQRDSEQNVYIDLRKIHFF